MATAKLVLVLNATRTTLEGRRETPRHVIIVVTMLIVFMVIVFMVIVFVSADISENLRILRTVFLANATRIIWAEDLEVVSEMFRTVHLVNVTKTIWEAISLVLVDLMACLEVAEKDKLFAKSTKELHVLIVPIQTLALCRLVCVPTIHYNHLEHSFHLVVAESLTPSP